MSQKKQAIIFGVTLFVVTIAMSLYYIGYQHFLLGKIYVTLQGYVNSVLINCAKSVAAAFVFYFVTQRADIIPSSRGTIFSAIVAYAISKTIITILFSYLIPIPFFFTFLIILAMSYMVGLYYKSLDKVANFIVGDILKHCFVFSPIVVFLTLPLVFWVITDATYSGYDWSQPIAIAYLLMGLVYSVIAALTVLYMFVAGKYVHRIESGISSSVILFLALMTIAFFNASWSI